MFSEQLVRRGHDVEVLTSCARDYVDWADEFEPGTSDNNGVVIHRLPVVVRRQDAEFGPIHHHMMRHPGRLPLFEQQRWANLMGPQLLGHASWLMKHCRRFDVAIFMTYLYTTTTGGLTALAGRIPTVLQPTAHDEPPLYVSLYKSLFRQPDGFIFFTSEEKQIVRKVFDIEPTGPTLGIGIEQNASPGNGDQFRRDFSIGPSPYVVYVGRMDPSKGVGELIAFFIESKRRTSRDLKIVLAGDAKMEIPDHPDIIVTGFLSEQQKRDAIAGSLALIQPSYFESFSIVLCEAWLQERPALVQGKCQVLRGQAIRSGGAIPYEGFAEFEMALHLLLDEPGLVREMGLAGRDYVRNNYDWDVVIGSFEEGLSLAIEKYGQRRMAVRPWQ